MSDKVDAKLIVPTPPNYIFLDIPGLVAEGEMQRPKIRVADLSTEQMDWLAKEWRAELEKTARRQIQVKEPAYRSPNYVTSDSGQ